MKVQVPASEGKPTNNEPVPIDKSQKVKPPFLTQKNNLKNDPSVVKALAKQSYEESLALHVRTGKMTEARREELLAKITMVASNDLTVFEGIESDIKVSKNDQNGNI